MMALKYNEMSSFSREMREAAKVVESRVFHGLQYLDSDFPIFYYLLEEAVGLGKCLLSPGS